MSQDTTAHPPALAQPAGALPALDLLDFDTVTTARLHLLHPLDGSRTTTWVELMGPDHPVRDAATLAAQRRVRAELQADGKLAASDPADDRAEELDNAVAWTVGWNLTRGGQPLPCTPETVRAVYTDVRTRWLYLQVLQGLRGRQLFTVRSARS